VLNKNHCLVDIFQVYGLKNIVSDPTCVKGEKHSLIDLVVTNVPKCISNVKCIDCGLSDVHNMVCFSTKMYAPVKQNTTITYRSYKHFDEELYKADLVCAPFHVGNIFDDINDSYWFCEKMLSDIVDKHAPVKKRLLKHKQVPYMNCALRRAINVRNMLKRKFDVCNSTVNWKKYRTQRSYVTKLRKQSLRNYMKTTCTENNSKSFWKGVKPLFSDKYAGPNEDLILQADGHIVNDQLEICNLLNNHFANVAKDTINKPYNGISDDANIEDIINEYSSHESITYIKNLNTNMSFNFKSVTVQEMVDMLSHINIKKSTGHDNIPPKMLKIGASILCFPFQSLINTSIANNVFPDSLKYAEVSPVFKKGDTLSPSNYRPISILTSISKLFEKVMVEQLSLYFEQIFSASMSGFRKGHNCEHVLLRLVENCKRRADEGLISGVVLTDLSKAFDTLHHSLFISKLHAYGVSLDSCKFIASYFMGRKQRVKLGLCKSDWTDVDIGAPQGSLMGPYSYNIFTNDLILQLENKCEIYNYADDNSVCCFATNFDDVKSNLECICKSMLEWFNVNYLQANPDKFQVIIFENGKNNERLLNIANTEVKACDVVKLLGVYIDKDMNFNYHISDLCKKAGRKINALSRISNTLDAKSKHIIYESFISSQFSYCVAVWNFCNVADIRKMEKLQKRALRYIYNDFCAIYQDLLEKSNLSLLYVRRMKTVLIQIFKIIHKLGPIYLHDLLSLKEKCYNFRNDQIAELPRCKSKKYGFNSFRYEGAKLWNVLPNELKCIDNVKEFKQRIYLWEGPICVCNTCILCSLYT